MTDHCEYYHKFSLKTDALNANLHVSLPPIEHRLDLTKSEKQAQISQSWGIAQAQ